MNLDPSLTKKTLASPFRHGMPGDLGFERVKALDFTKVEEIHQNEFGVTRKTDPKPMLVTYGLVNCVGVAGYSEDTGVGFLAHYQDNTELPLAISMLLYHISQSADGQAATFRVRIKGGISGMSEHLVSGLRSRLALPLREDIRFELDGNTSDVLRPDIGGVDLGIDTQTGALIETYNPLQNPYHREHLPPEYQDLVFNSTTPSVRYVPKG